MKRVVFIFMILTFSSVKPVIAQTGKHVVFTVGNETVYNDEFERVFSKNSKPGKGRPSQEELEEYLQLYIKFKLKVKEAYARGLDTNKAFVDELTGYRKQLAQPYLTDKEVTEQLIHEAYERMKTEVKVSHIMVRLAAYATPTDTLRAFTRIMQWRDRIVKFGEAFDSVAYQYSEDESAKFNYGDLGYFSTFAMIYPFENMAYTTPIGQISMPFRTQFGYHIIVVKDKRTARGEVKAAHLMVRFNNDGEILAAKVRMDSIYKKLTEGMDFNKLVQDYSEDYSTKTRNGELNWMNSTAANIPVQFREAAYNLKNIGDYSEPIKTDFGWHIIKLLERKPLASYDEMKETIKNKVQRDQRSEKNKEVVLVRIKKENNFLVDEKSLVAYISLVDSGINSGSWTPTEKLKTETKLFSIANRTYSYADFSNFIKETQVAKADQAKDALIRGYFKEFSDKRNLEYEEEILESKYPDFKYLMQEYRDGILLFELTDKMVWSKSVEDTVGLKEFHNANKQKYLWKDRSDFDIYTCKDAKSAEKVKRILKKKPNESVDLTKLNAKDPNMVKVEHKLIEKGNDKLYENFAWTPGIHDIGSNGTFVFANVKRIIPPEPKMLTDAMGMITTDYQSFLETNWISVLQEKYPVVVSPNAIENLFK
jgi:peptidyl-prolyl cis-trans isomerase SurA